MLVSPEVPDNIDPPFRFLIEVDRRVDVDHYTENPERLHYWVNPAEAACGKPFVDKSSAFEHRSLKMAEAPISKKRKRGNPNQTTGLIGVRKNGNKYLASIRYGGKQHNLGRFDTKEQAGIPYDRFVVEKSTEEVFFTLNYPNGPSSSGTK